MNKPEAILLDMGGVLLDPADRWDAEGFEKSFPEGLPEPELRDWFLAMSMEIAETFLALAPPRPAMDVRPFIMTWLWKRRAVPSPDEVDRWFDVLCQWEARPVYDFVPAALRALHDMGFRLGLISNTIMPGTHIRKAFRQTGILDLFERTLFSAEFGANKPHPSLFRHVLDTMGLEANEAWYVGDKPQRDVRGAHAVGMTAVLVDSPHVEHIHDAPENVPDLRIPNIAALPQVLKDL